ncbi:MAG: TerC family protein [Alphaproteobacteria bacterium]|jgi:tellurite resistance protein TerC|nr:TerC family protein [Rickettsiales bacterium]
MLDIALLNHPLWMWAGFFLLITLLLAFDLGVLNRRAKPLSISHALKLSVFYISLGLLFSLWVFEHLGREAGYQYLTGYLIEKTLSLDNIFVFVLIFQHFAVPAEYQHRVLFWGIIGAIILRGAFIVLGTTLIAQFDWMLYLLGTFLIYTGIKMLLAADATPNLNENRFIRFLSKHGRMTANYEGAKFFVRRDGVLYMTPLLLVLLVIDVADVVFAVDSIPAIFAITQDTFVVLTSNIFAILGLRALYFALAAMMHRFEYLKYGLSLVLVFIGGKMLINHAHNYTLIEIEYSLLFTVGVITLSVLLSLFKTRNQS